MRARARRSGGEFAPTARGFQRFMSFASGCSNPSILGRAFLCDLVDSQNKLTFGRRVAGDCTLIPLSQGGRLGRASPLFATAFQAKQSIGSPARIDRG